MNRRPAPPSPLHFTLSTRGLTLVELMVVVAIVGVLAAIGGMSYTKYVNAGKVTEMRQWAMDIARGQEQFYSRNNQYYEPDNDYTAESTDDAQWTNLLEFNAQLPADVTITVEAAIGGNCTICDGIDDPDGAGAANQAWFAILIKNDDIERNVFFHNDLNQPIELEQE